jgi:hypothetical protein
MIIFFFIVDKKNSKKVIIAPKQQLREKWVLKREEKNGMEKENLC